jgi:hypothetical protein
MELRGYDSMQRFSEMYPEEFAKIVSYYWWHELEGTEKSKSWLWMVVCFNNKRSLSAIKKLFRPFLKRCYIYGRDMRTYNNPNVGKNERAKSIVLKNRSCPLERNFKARASAILKWGSEVVLFEPPINENIEEDSYSPGKSVKEEEMEDEIRIKKETQYKEDQKEDIDSINPFSFEAILSKKLKTEPTVF